MYQLAEPGALSEPLRPTRPDGSPDACVAARLSVRHDDSKENATQRLALWDRQVRCSLKCGDSYSLCLCGICMLCYVSLSSMRIMWAPTWCSQTSKPCVPACGHGADVCFHHSCLSCVLPLRTYCAGCRRQALCMTLRHAPRRLCSWRRLC